MYIYSKIVKFIHLHTTNAQLQHENFTHSSQKNCSRQWQNTAPWDVQCELYSIWTYIYVSKTYLDIYTCDTYIYVSNIYYKNIYETSPPQHSNHQHSSQAHKTVSNPTCFFWLPWTRLYQHNNQKSTHIQQPLWLMRTDEPRKFHSSIQSEVCGCRPTIQVMQYTPDKRPKILTHDKRWTQKIAFASLQSDIFVGIDPQPRLIMQYTPDEGKKSSTLQFEGVSNCIRPGTEAQSALHHPACARGQNMLPARVLAVGTHEKSLSWLGGC